jgi:hypothetical protein
MAPRTNLEYPHEGLFVVRSKVNGFVPHVS